MNNEIARKEIMPAIMESVLMAGDLAKLSPQQRVSFYGSVCESVGLNPLTRPFEYLNLNGKLTLYATKNCADQLRYVHHISVLDIRREVSDGILITTVSVSNPQGRRDEDIGAISVAGLQGEAKSNAWMKCTTKAKRRATLSICGLSMPDESEIDSIKGARIVPMEVSTGELIEQAKQIDASGQPIGTQAAADAVAERKIADLKEFKTKRTALDTYREGGLSYENAVGAIKDLSVKESTNGKGPDYYHMLEAFKQIKPIIGSDAYYDILGGHGFKKSNEIKDANLGRDIYREMKSCMKAQSEKAMAYQSDAAEPLEVSEADIVEVIDRIRQGKDIVGVE